MPSLCWLKILMPFGTRQGRHEIFWGSLMNGVLWFFGAVLVTVAITVAGAFFPVAVIGSFAVVILLVMFSGTASRFLRGRSVPSAQWHLGLLMFPLVCAMRTVNMTTAVALMVILALSTFFRRVPDGGGYSRHWPVVLLCLAFVGVVVRPSSLPAALFAIFALIFLIRAVARVTRHGAVTSLIDGVGLYLIANVVAYYAFGLRSPGASLRSGGLESADGGVRVIYPLATSLNLPPILAAAFLAASLILLERGAKKLLRLAGAGAACIVLVGADSRTALIAAVAVAFSSLFLPRLLRGLSLPAAIGAIVFAFLFPVISGPIVAPIITWLTGLVPGLSRGSTANSDMSLNGREFIWSRSLTFWTDRTNEFGQAFGYGAQGQYTSGASSTYAQIFGSALQNPRMASTHNSMLQQLYDCGLVGLALLALTVVACIALWIRRSRIDEPYSAAALAMALSLVISSVSEVSLAPGVGQETMFIFAGLLLAACTSLEDGPKADAILKASSRSVVRAA